MVHFYDRGLIWVLRHKRFTLAATVATLGLTVFSPGSCPKDFFPQQDTGLIVGVTEASPSISFPAMMDLQRHAADVIRADPDVQAVASFIGADGTNPRSTGRLSVTLKSRHQRKSDADAIIARLTPQLREVSGISVYLQSVQDLQVDTRTSRTQFQLTLEDADPTVLDTWAPRVLNAMKDVPSLRDVASDRQSTGLGLSLVIDRDLASSLGITAQNLDDTLYDAFGQRQVSTIFTQLNLYRVILEVAPSFQQDPDGLRSIYVRSATGDPISLATIAHYEQSPHTPTIAHQGQFPAATLSFNLAPGAALGDAVAAIDGAMQSLNLPASVHPSFQGTAKVFSVAGQRAHSHSRRAHYRLHRARHSLRKLHPPHHHFEHLALCRRGRVARAHDLPDRVQHHRAHRHHPAHRHREEECHHDDRLRARSRARKGPDPESAIHQACLLRFRPIMMTTMAALLGGLPMALGQGTGAELRRPLGIAIVGGLLISQVLTLYTTPVIYLAMDRLRHLGRAAKPVVVVPARNRRRGTFGVNISGPFLRRPIATSLLAVALVLAGLTAYGNLAVAPLPRVDFPTINVQAALPGASPETMASSVATPLERRFGRIAGLTQITSSSSLGATGITLQFDLSRDITGAARDVQAAINAAGGELPPNLPSLPTYRKVNPADAPVLIVGLTSDTLPLAQVYDTANSILAQKVSQVKGVGQVFVGGGQQPAVRVQVDLDALAGLGLGMVDVRNALAQSTVNSPEGVITNNQRTLVLSSNDQLFGSESFRNLIVAYRGGAPVRLRDVATVFDDVENNRVAGWVDGKRAVVLIIRREPGANILDTIDRVKALLPTLATSISPAIKMQIALDCAGTIRASVRDVETTLFISIGLVVLVVLLVLASRAGHADSRRGHSAVANRDFRGHVFARLQHRQPLAHGADHRHRLRRRRRHRRGGEHHAPRGAGHGADRGRVSGGARNRLHHRVDYRVPARGFHSLVTHGRHRRAPFSRILGHPQHRHRGLGRGFADAHADHGLAPVAPIVA